MRFTRHFAMRFMVGSPGLPCRLTVHEGVSRHGMMCGLSYPWVSLVYGKPARSTVRCFDSFCINQRISRSSKSDIVITDITTLRKF